MFLFFYHKIRLL